LVNSFKGDVHSRGFRMRFKFPCVLSWLGFWSFCFFLFNIHSTPYKWLLYQFYPLLKLNTLHYFFYCFSSELTHSPVLNGIVCGFDNNSSWLDVYFETVSICYSASGLRGGFESNVFSLLPLILLHLNTNEENLQSGKAFDISLLISRFLMLRFISVSKIDSELAIMSEAKQPLYLPYFFRKTHISLTGGSIESVREIGSENFFFPATYWSKAPKI